MGFMYVSVIGDSTSFETSSLAHLHPSLDMLYTILNWRAEQISPQKMYGVFLWFAAVCMLHIARPIVNAYMYAFLKAVLCVVRTILDCKCIAGLRENTVRTDSLQGGRGVSLFNRPSLSVIYFQI